MLDALNCRDFGKLGGWVFTSYAPSPMAVLQLEQSRRQLKNRCFACDQGHHAKHVKCPGDNQHCWYKCLKCGTRNDISSRGQSTLQQGSPAVAAASLPTLPGAKAAPPRPGPATIAPPPLVTAPARLPLRLEQEIAASAIRKRPAAVAFQDHICANTFQQCWAAESVRKEPKPPHKARYAAARDFLRAMDTKQAGGALGTIPERLRTISNKAARAKTKWSKQEWDLFQEFGRAGGGGRKGVGCTEKAMTALYHTLGGRGD